MATSKTETLIPFSGNVTIYFMELLSKKITPTLDIIELILDYISWDFPKTTLSFNCILESSSFHEGNFNHSFFRNNNMENISFHKGNFLATIFSETNLKQAVFRHCNFGRTTFFKSNLTNTTLNNITFVDTKFIKCIMKRTNLSRETLEEISFNHTILTKADFSYCDISSSEFNQTDLSGAGFNSADIRATEFTKAKLTTTDFRNTKINHCDFSEVDATGAIFNNCIIQNTSFQNANLTGADFTGVTNFTGTNFTGANITDALFDSTVHFTALLSKCVKKSNIEMENPLKQEDNLIASRKKKIALKIKKSSIKKEEPASEKEKEENIGKKSTKKKISVKIKEKEVSLPKEKEPSPKKELVEEDKKKKIIKIHLGRWEERRKKETTISLEAKLATIEDVIIPDIPDDITVYEVAMRYPPPGWESLIQEKKSELKQISNNLVKRAQNETYTPRNKDVYRALWLTRPENIRLVIIGQDPYPAPGVATGLAFSTSPGNGVPASLKNIYKEIKNCYKDYVIPSDGCLDHWAKQGVFLLNTCLTCPVGVPDGHAKFGLWLPFVVPILKLIGSLNKECYYFLWGKRSQEFQQYITAKPANVFTSSHPSPMSARFGFEGCGHFKLVNKKLDPPIKW